jgi:hypothetical protein
MTMRNLALPAVLAVLASGPTLAAEHHDLSKIERRIKSQPTYVAKEPLYGLYVFGPNLKTRVWAVLDKSAVTNVQYDVLYFDRDADGDLTEENERIVGQIDEGNVEFVVGDFADPNSDDIHTAVSLTRRASQDGSVMMNLRWQGREPMRGGYAEEAGPYAQFATKVSEAPILWFDASGLFGFQRWIWTKDLMIGGETDVPVFLGHQGLGKNTFCAVSQNFLQRSSTSTRKGASSGSSTISWNGVEASYTTARSGSLMMLALVRLFFGWNCPRSPAIRVSPPTFP